MRRLLVGTEKGGYVLTRSHSGWTAEGPLFPGWKVTAFGRAPDGTHLAAVASNWFGVGIHRSRDLQDWDPIDNPPSWDESSDRKMEQVWRFRNADGRVYAGVAHAGLFVSDDGATWAPIAGLNEHRTRPDWQPGLGGLAAHGILTASGSMWVGISAVGVFRSDDGGANWDLKNDGIPAAGTPEGAPRPEVGYCVHALAQDPDQPDHIWRQDHMGMHRTRDGGDTWERIAKGLPADFGFTIWRDHGSGRLFTVPLESDENRLPVEGQLRVFSSDDEGDSWAVAGSGWPNAPHYTAVLRGAYDGDGDGFFAFGTTGGDVWVTEDNGGSWDCLDAAFPRIAVVSLP